MAQGVVLLSACLAGVNCVYDGSNNFKKVFKDMHAKGEAVIFCPEVLGGLKIPHEPSEITGGDGFDVLEGRARVVSKKGDDVTENFIAGAEAVLNLARKSSVRKAILKQKSPSCGCGLIFDGTFSKKLIKGCGVATALLKNNGIEVISDVDFLNDKGKDIDL